MAQMPQIVLAQLSSDLGDMASTLGIVDMNAVMAKLNRLAPSITAAQVIRDMGMTAINAADNNAIGVAILAGERAKRAEIKGHLQYYYDNPGQLASGFYDLRDWCARAFVAYNAVVEVNSAVAGNSFWSAVWESFRQLPETLGEAASSVASSFGKGLGSGILGASAGLLKNPLGLAVIAGGIYLWYTFGRRRA